MAYANAQVKNIGLPVVVVIVHLALFLLGRPAIVRLGKYFIQTLIFAVPLTPKSTTTPIRHLVSVRKAFFYQGPVVIRARVEYLLMGSTA